MNRLSICLTALVLSIASIANADVTLPNIFGSHMVLQQGQKNKVWGWADAGENVTVTIGGQTHSATADKDGNWSVKLESMKVGSGPHKMSVQGKNEVSFDDILVGEVWICSGQSNMAWSVDRANDPKLEILAAKFPNIRLISVPQVGTQEPQKNFTGEWARCSPETVGQFSAVGYFFGRQLHQTLGVPIGLIDNAWGGSACEAWIPRDVLKAEGRYEELLKKWTDVEADYDYDALLTKYKERAKKARAAGKPVGRAPRNLLAGNHRPANIYNGVLKPTIGYGIRGAIWYQGESNSGRAYQYRHLFPLMISQWRKEWAQGDFPFYWVQLADFRSEVAEPQDSTWAELREAQTMTQSLPNTGQAVIIDIGEGRDIHPRNKQDVAKRLARLALAKDYGVDVPHRSPDYNSMKVVGNKIVVKLDHVGSALYTFDVREPIGFTIAGEDKKFYNAKAKLVGKDSVEVWSDQVAKPVAVRYAWADNPICNLRSRDGLPATPFRTDDWEGITANVLK
ncbi:MAG: sialate O-acetylesterase [Planctomycetaceae bacterium]|nr:sialate O-acetylesterase [Planctomycetaceae bacterium]